MPDLAILAIEGLFGLLFVTSLWTAIRHRDALARDVTLVFLPLAALLVVQLAGSIFGPTPQWLGSTSTILLLAQPVFSLKLVSDLRAIPRGVLVSAIAAFAVTATPLGLLGSGAGLQVTLAAVAAFVVTGAVAAAYLALEGRSRSGSARMRLVVASLATAGLALAVLLAGAAAATSLPAEVSSFATRAVALAAAIAYWIAFLPPAWLRDVFQATEAFRYNERLLASPPSALADELWEDLAAAARHLTGTAAVVLAIDEDSLRVVAANGVDLDEPIAHPVQPGAGLTDETVETARRDLVTRSGRPFVRAVPIVRDGVRVGLVCLLRDHASLFDTDDARLVASLAARSANLVQRREALATQERLAEQLRLTVDALEAASSAKSDFLASMSHELRTPLNAIIGFSELMINEAGSADTVTVPREWVDHIRNGGSHLVALINDVLDLAKVEAGRLELARFPVELGHAVTESVAGLRPLADRKQQRLTVSVEPHLIEVDPGRLRQILYNLLSNAIKYTGEGGSIDVTATRDGAEIRIAVSDTGVGISDDDQQHVFEEFRQVGDRAGHVAGTGLGLALTRRLVEAHGGRIELRSVVGEGSTFTVVLPIGSAHPPQPATTGGGVPVPGGGARVLIVEDDPSSVRLLQAYLAESGYEVTVAPDGERGLELARADPPAAILLDVLLPGIDGWEVLRHLKSDPAVRDVPVVIVTVVDERNVGLALGAVDYFVKPIEREALIARLDRHTFTTKVKARTLNVLAVDDDPAALTMIDATLSPLGFAVRGASSGREGLDLAIELRPDLVICDLLMPEIDGFEVVARLHENPATSAIPILILTAHELTESDKARLNGRVLGVVDKGESAARGLREWLSRVIPEVIRADPA
jgi:signal transduction histidine kinase/CheY-like chemotaxis protein